MKFYLSNQNIVFKKEYMLIIYSENAKFISIFLMISFLQDNIFSFDIEET